MSLYSHGFEFLPRPPRMALSMGSEATRSQLPDFATVAELSEFVRRLAYYRLPINGLYIQLKTGASIICALIVIVMLIIARRMYEHSFWIIRTMKRASGMILIPNAMLCFSIIEGFYGIMFVAFLWEVSKFYESYSSQPINFPLWLLFPWIPLIIGALWAAWGTYFAIPDTLQSSFGAGKQSFISRFFSHAMVINSTGLLIPIVISITVVIPAAFCDARFQHALNLINRFQATYATQTEFSQEMVQDAQRAWYAMLKSMMLLAGTFIIWVFWALVMFISYSTISSRLIVAVRKELHKAQQSGPQRIVVATTHVTTQHRENANGDEAAGRHVHYPSQSIAFSDRKRHSTAATTTKGDGDVESRAHSAGRKGSVASTATMINSTPNLSKTHENGKDEEFDSFTAQKTPMTPASARFAKIASASDGDGEILVPHKLQTNLPETPNEGGEAVEMTQRRTLMPNIMMQKPHASAVPARSSRSEQKKELRKAFIHICIQFFAISPACVCFMFIAMLMAVTAYGTMEQPRNGGNGFELYLAIALVLVNWVTCVFGGITVMAIAQRTYEPVFNAVHFPIAFGGPASGSGSGDVLRNEGFEGAGRKSASGPGSDRRGNSVALMSMKKSPRPNASSRPSQVDEEEEDATNSTFFETQTKLQQRSINMSRGAAASHGISDTIEEDVPTNDIDPEDDGHYDHELQQMDLFRNGLFIERILETEEEHSPHNDQASSTTRKNTRGTGQSYLHPRAPSPAALESFSEAPRASYGRQQSSAPASDFHRYGDDSRLSDSDDGEAYFRGGAGRRKRDTPRQAH